MIPPGSTGKELRGKGRPENNALLGLTETKRQPGSRLTVINSQWRACSTQTEVLKLSLPLKFFSNILYQRFLIHLLPIGYHRELVQQFKPFR